MTPPGVDRSGRRAVRQHRGRLVDFTGDNFLVEFSTATAAVGCAFEIRGVLRARNAGLPAERRMEFRIGVVVGVPSVPPVDQNV